MSKIMDFLQRHEFIASMVFTATCFLGCALICAVVMFIESNWDNELVRVITCTIVGWVGASCLVYILLFGD